MGQRVSDGEVGPLIAIDIIALSGFAGVLWCGLYWKRREQKERAS